MGWVRVEDDFYDNDKMLTAGCLGRDLFWHGLAFCNRNLTDGLVPKSVALRLVDFTGAAVLTGSHGGVDGQECAPYAVRAVLESGLWHEDGHDCPDCVQPGSRHYIVHDYLKYQPSRAEVEVSRADLHTKRSEAGRRGGRRSAEVRQANREANGKQTDKQTVSKSQPPTPTPTPTPLTPPKSPDGNLGGGPQAAPRPTCTKHPHGNTEDTACRGCMKARLWDEAQAEAEAADELHAKRRAREQAESCATCDGTNWIPDTEPAVRCDHGEVAHA